MKQLHEVGVLHVRAINGSYVLLKEANSGGLVRSLCQPGQAGSCEAVGDEGPSTYVYLLTSFYSPSKLNLVLIPLFRQSFTASHQV